MSDIVELGLSSAYSIVPSKWCIFNNYLHLSRHHSAGNNIDSHCTITLIYKGQDLVLSVH